MAIEPKISRKDLKLKQPDQFQVLNARFVKFCLENRGALIIVALVIIAVVAGFLFYSQLAKSNVLEMENRYFKLDKLRIQMEKKPAPALFSQMQEMLSGFTEGPQKIRARLLLADIHFREGRYGAAETLYQDVINNISQNDFKYNVAQSGLAYSLEGKKDYKRAIKIYKSIIDSAHGFPLFYTYVALSRCHELSGDPKSAILVLREIQSKFQRHSDIGKVSLMIRRLEG